MLGLLLAPNIASESAIAPTSNFEEVYLKPLPSFPVKATCNCKEYAKELGVGDRVSEVPVLLGGVVLAEGRTGHIAVIISIDEKDILVIESNYISCQITYRRLSLTYSKIRGFVY